MSVVSSSAASYTKEQLAEEARAAGFDQATPRLVLSWSQRGLLGRPIRPGRGQGRGRAAVWPAGQLKLFLILLGHRQRGASLAALTNVPVFLWLLDAPDISAPQIGRALRTWVDAETSVPMERARLAAQRVAQVLMSPDANRGAAKRLVDVLATAIHSGRFDRDAVLDAVQRIFDPRFKKRELGHPEARLNVETSVLLIEARFLTARRLLEQRLEDAQRERARLVYRATRLTYAKRQPEFARTSGRPDLYDDVDLDSVANSACSDLLTILGLEIMRPNSLPTGAQVVSSENAPRDRCRGPGGSAHGG